MELFSGTGTLAFDLKSSGMSGLDALTRLGGTVSVTLPEGGSARCSVLSIEAAARTDQPGGGEPCALETPLSPLTAARAQLDHGVLSLEPVESGIAQPPVRLEGSIDLVTKIIDMRVSAPGVNGDDSPLLPVTIHGRPESLTFSQP